MKAEYSAWKAAHFQERIDLLKMNKLCSPVHLQIGLTDDCNQKCFYCSNHESRKAKNELDIRSIMLLLEDAKEMGVKAITLHGGGEPTSHPEFWRIVEKIHEFGFELGLITNGTDIRSTELSFATWVRISIDSFNIDTYYRIRKTAQPNFNNIKKLCNESRGSVGASCVITHQNYKEIYCFASKAKDMGFSYVYFIPVYIQDNPIYLIPFWKECEGYLNKSQELEDSKFSIFIQPIENNIPKVKNKPFAKCLIQHFTPFIGPNGNIYPCCEAQSDINTSVGNVITNRFKDIWYSRPIIEVDNCKLGCLRNCEKNIFMNYLLMTPPHMNFV